MRALVIGGDGLIGRRLVAMLRAGGGEVPFTSRRASAGSIALDLSQDAAGRMPLPATDVAFFCAAITRFAYCEADPALARRVNVDGPSALARRLAKAGTHVVLLSTAAVFGAHPPRLAADAAPTAATLYGRLKAEAEAAFLSLGGAASVLRLTKVLHADMPLVTGWIETLAGGGTVRAFTDLGLAPIGLDHAVDALIAIANARTGGIYQASASRDIAYADAARHIAERMGVGGDRVVAVTGVEAGLPAAQAVLVTSLDTARLDALTGRAAPDPLDVIDAVYGPAIERAATDLRRR